jgi:hypothetical protein
MEVGSKVHNAVKLAAGATFALTALTTTLRQATTGKGSNQGAPIDAQLAFTVSRIIGPQATTLIMPAQAGKILLPGQGVSPLGVFNGNTASGIIALVANWAIKMGLAGSGIGAQYNRYAAPFINALGGGLLLGGVVGGLLDAPDPSQMGSQGSPFLSYNPILPLNPQSTLQAQTSAASQPYLSAARIKLHGR